jgi:hypothetical protein
MNEAWNNYLSKNENHEEIQPENLINLEEIIKEKEKTIERLNSRIEMMSIDLLYYKQRFNDVLKRKVKKYILDSVDIVMDLVQLNNIFFTLAMNQLKRYVKKQIEEFGDFNLEMLDYLYTIQTFRIFEFTLCQIFFLLMFVGYTNYNHYIINIIIKY